MSLSQTQETRLAALASPAVATLDALFHLAERRGWIAEVVHWPDAPDPAWRYTAEVTTPDPPLDAGPEMGNADNPRDALALAIISALENGGDKPEMVE